ncbi:MAG: hypothetical protein IAE67_10240 [Candidatus Competibacteraceae bacterium]|nr:hypothetical protein [Candidatus Competibacteraceae bacterium]
MITPVELIQKENVKLYKFVTGDVLTTAEEKKLRMAQLEKAMLLGNGYKGKVKIIFETQEGAKAVETTVWQTGQENIMLKGGVNIPIRCIREVQI